MVRLLFLASASFLFLSSSTAALLGWQQVRVVLFSLVIASLAGAAVMCRPSFPARRYHLPVALLWLLTMIALLDVGGAFQLFDYKIVLPVIALLIAPNLAETLGNTDLTRIAYRLLSAYCAVMAGTLLLGASNVVARGYDGLLRIDLTGSIVTHASLCIITLVLASARAAGARGFWRLLALAVAVAACLMALLTGTRTAALTLVLLALLSIWAGPQRGRQVQASFLAGIGALSVLGIYTLTVSDAFYLRLLGDGALDYSSGRLHSLGWWLAMAADHPLGHGIGFVREVMAEGRPFIDGGRFLEWPHNELVRFYVEAGLPGLLMVTLLIGGMLARALRSAAVEKDPERRFLVLALAADMVAQCLLQNYLNTVYHSTVLLMLLAVLIERPSVYRHEDEGLLNLSPGEARMTGSGDVPERRPIHL